MVDKFVATFPNAVPGDSTTKPTISGPEATAKADAQKNEGNVLLKSKDYRGAIACYTKVHEALRPMNLFLCNSINILTFFALWNCQGMRDRR